MSASLISVNVGLPREVEWRGKRVRTGIWKEPVAGPGARGEAQPRRGRPGRSRQARRLGEGGVSLPLGALRAVARRAGHARPRLGRLRREPHDRRTERGDRADRGPPADRHGGVPGHAAAAARATSSRFGSTGPTSSGVFCRPGGPGSTCRSSWRATSRPATRSSSKRRARRARPWPRSRRRARPRRSEPPPRRAAQK